MKLVTLAVCFVLLVSLIPLRADEEHQHFTSTEKLGTVSFPTSCSASVQKPFERGVALLHSFWYDGADKQFKQVARTLRANAITSKLSALFIASTAKWITRSARRPMRRRWRRSLRNILTIMKHQSSMRSHCSHQLPIMTRHWKIPKKRLLF